MPDSIPVILSQARPGQDDHTRPEADLVDALSGRPGVELHVVPHLYDLAPDGPAMEHLRSIQGDMIVLSWLYPRAAFWILDAQRVRGRFGEGGSGEPEGERRTRGSRTSTHPTRSARGSRASTHPTRSSGDRTIWCLDLRAHGRAELYLGQIGEIVDAALTPSGPHAPAPTAAANLVEEATRPRWYPVVDYDRCTNCLECLNFCLFGVYGLDSEGAIVAEDPDACRPGCPACARICPAAAIMFPEHASAAIAGDPEAAAEGLKLDLSQLFGGADPADLAAGERDRALADKRRQEAALRPDGPTSSPAKDNLDRLVDELDGLDL